MLAFRRGKGQKLVKQTKKQKHSLVLSERFWLLCAMPHVVLMMVLVLSPRAFVCIRSRFSSFFSVYVCVTANVDCHYAHRCILTMILSALCLFALWFGLFGHPACLHSDSNIILSAPKTLQVIELEVTFGEFRSHFLKSCVSEICVRQITVNQNFGECREQFLAKFWTLTCYEILLPNFILMLQFNRRFLQYLSSSSLDFGWIKKVLKLKDTKLWADSIMSK